MKKGKSKVSEDILKLPLDVRAEMALKEAVAGALAEHKRRGNSIAVWRDGKAVWVPPDEIVIPKI